MTRLVSNAMLFTFAVLGPGIAAQGATTHVIDIYADSKATKFYYQHSDQGVKGYVFVKKGHSVSWSCNASNNCKSLAISFANISPCKTLTVAADKVPAVCGTIDVGGATTCAHAGKNRNCIAYTATVTDMNGAVMTEDPEFIVDNNPTLR